MKRKVLAWMLLCATILFLCTVIMPIGIANAEDAHFDTKEYPAHMEVFTSEGESTKFYVHDSFTTSGTPTPTPTSTTPPITTTPLLHPTNGPLKVEFEKTAPKILKIHIENPGPDFVYIPSSTKEGDINFKISGITWGGKLEAYVESTHPHERWAIYAKDVYKNVKLPVMLVQIVLNPPKSAVDVVAMAGPMLLKSATGIDTIGETLDSLINHALEQKTESFILFTKCFLYCKHPTTKNIEPKESDQFAGGISKSCFAIVTHGVILSPIIYNKAAYNDYKNKYDLPKKGAGYVLLPESRLVIELTYEEIREDKLGLMIKEYQALRGSRGTGRSDDLEYTLLHIYQGNYEGSEHVHSMVRSGTTFDYYSFDSISSISITPSIPPEIDFNILLKPDKPTYRRGETAQVTIDVTNNRDQDTEIWLGTTFKYPTLKDPKDIPLKRAVIPKGKTKSFDDIEWTIPPDAPLGQYEIAVNCYKDAGQNEDYTDNIEWAPIFNVDTTTPTPTTPPDINKYSPKIYLDNNEKWKLSEVYYYGPLYGYDDYAGKECYCIEYWFKFNGDGNERGDDWEPVYVFIDLNGNVLYCAATYHYRWDSKDTEVDDFENNHVKVYFARDYHTPIIDYGDALGLRTGYLYWDDDPSVYFEERSYSTPSRLTYMKYPHDTEHPFSQERGDFLEKIDFDILLKPDKTTYRRGETAQVTIDVTNNRDHDTEIWLGTTFKYPTLKDPEDIPLKRAVIPKGETESFDIEWTIPADAPIGQYEIAVNCYKDAWQNEYYTDNIVWAPIFNVDVTTPVLTPPPSEFDLDALLALISDFFEAIIGAISELVSSLQQKPIEVPPEEKARENVEDALGALAGMADAYSGFMSLITDLAEVEPPRYAEVKFEYHVLSARFCNNIAEAETYMSFGGIKSSDMNDALELVRELELAKTGFCIVIVDYSFIGFGEYESGKYPIVCNEKGDPFWGSWQFYEKIKEELEAGYKG